MDTQVSPRLRHLERWLTEHQRLILATVVLVSVLLRLGYFLELNQGPCIWQHRWDQSDMHFFDAWARDIAGGDWLTDKSLHPLHGWHQVVAAEYFRLYPEQATALEGDGASGSTPEVLAQGLWNRWYGGKAFHQEPLYPYLVALTYKVFGPEVRWVFLWQMLVGVGSNILVYLIARQCFGVVVAAVAGFLAVLCGPLLFYELVLLRESLITFMWLALVYLAGLAMARGTWRWWFLTGLAGGLGMLLKMTFLPYSLGLLGILAYRGRAAPRLLGRSLAALLVGVAICLPPVVARNVAVGVPPLTLQSVSTITFIGSNAEDLPPGPGFFFSVHSARIMARIMASTNGAFIPAAIDTLKTHPTPGSFLRQIGGKFAWMWRWYESPNNKNFYYYRLHSRVLRYLPVTFLILAPLSMVGLALAVGRRLLCGPLYLAVFINVITLLLTYILSRYRLPLLALLAPFAALTIVRISEWVLTRRLARAVVAVASVLLLSLWTMRPLPPGVHLIRPADYQAAYLVYYYPLAEEAQDKGDWPRMANILEDSLRYEPAVVREMGFFRPPQDKGEAQLALFYAEVHYLCAQARQNSASSEAALKHKTRANELWRAGQDSGVWR
jgi:hypothetical protein